MKPVAPSGSTAVMARRVEPPDSLDYFPTPPWATRALYRHVLPLRAAGDSVWEPACGEGHMSAPLAEFFSTVMATDIFDYSGGDPSRWPPDWRRTLDFLDERETPLAADWIITNPPFTGATDRALAFALRALELARTGVALFVRTQWAVEGIERYERLFRDRQPTLFASFVERVNLCRGCWDPDGSTATAYCWLVWVKGQAPRPQFFIPPGCRKGLTKPDDARRFGKREPAPLLESDKA